jgi:hypothetical protein
MHSLEFWLQIYWWNIKFKSGGSRSTDWIILVEILLSFGYYQLSFRKLCVIQLSISVVNGLYICIKLEPVIKATTWIVFGKPLLSGIYISINNEVFEDVNTGQYGFSLLYLFHQSTIYTSNIYWDRYE